MKEQEKKETVQITVEKCTGCAPTTPYGGCYYIDGVCTWIPEFGLESDEK